MELILGTWHQVSGDGKEDELEDEWLLKIDLNVLVRKYPLAFDEKHTHLRLSYDVPPVLTILDNVLDHFVVVTLKLVVFLVVE